MNYGPIFFKPVQIRRSNSTPIAKIAERKHEKEEYSKFSQPSRKIILSDFQKAMKKYRLKCSERIALKMDE